MRLGIMLRHYDQHMSGVRVYTQQLMRALFALRSQHEFVLFYKNPALVGTYAHEAAVTEVHVPGKSILWWDQVAIPAAARKYRIDALFNPKYSMALAADCPTAWVCHGLDWYVMPEASPWLDRLSHRYLVPRYAAKANAIIAVSELTKAHVIDYLKVPAERVHTVYTAVSDEFNEPITGETLHATRKRYGLPSKYFLYVGAIYPPKNFTRIVQAYAKVGPRLGIPLVIAGGKNRYLSEHELKEPQRLGIEHWVRWLGWIDNATLPALYHQAEALLFPSLFESFGLPLLEAMATDCPIVTSNRYGTKEIAADAALLVDPESVDDIATAIERIATQTELRQKLIAAGKTRVQRFNWQRCAQETLAVLESIASSTAYARQRVSA